MKTLILTVGLPRSGKSTWAKEQGIPIVNPDSIRLAIHGQAYIKEAEGFVWEIAYTMTRALFIAGHNSVIIDATNTTEKRRQAWREKFTDCKISYSIFCMCKAECIKRAKKDNRLDLIPVIEKMDEEFESIKENE